MTLFSRLIRRAQVGHEPYPVSADGQAGPSGRGPGGEGCGSGESEEAEDEMKRIKGEARQEGYAACRAEMEAEVKEKVGSFTAMVSDLQTQRKRLITDSEEAVVELACEIARRMVGQLAEVNEETILEVVRNALGHLADRQRVTIRVNPADAGTLRAHEREWDEAAGAGSVVEIAEDVRIKRGGCLIEGESGSVEAQLDRQVDMIAKALREAVHAG